MNDDELTRLHQRIDDAIAAPLAMVTSVIGELERVRAELQVELDTHRREHPLPEVATAERRAAPQIGSHSLGSQSETSTSDRRGERERRRPLPTLGEPIGINRPSFQS
ncbi:MAG: hypothetical protein R2710_26560 [Acidimicrobiales bacterium]